MLKTGTAVKNSIFQLGVTEAHARISKNVFIHRSRRVGVEKGAYCSRSVFRLSLSIARPMAFYARERSPCMPRLLA